MALSKTMEVSTRSMVDGPPKLSFTDQELHISASENTSSNTNINNDLCISFNHIIREKDYALNESRSLDKKLEASKRDVPIQVSNTGGGIVITCDAGAYENVKHSMIEYYKNYKSYEHIGVQFIESKDRNASNSETVIKLVSQANSTCYVVNMYHTTSKFLINGKGISRFTMTDLPNILQKVNVSSDLNQRMQEMLQAIQLPKKGSKVSVSNQKLGTPKSAPNIQERSPCYVRLDRTSDVVPKVASIAASPVPIKVTKMSTKEVKVNSDQCLDDCTSLTTRARNRGSH